MAYRGAICNQNGCPRAVRIIAKLYAKIQGPNSKDEKVISLLIPFRNRQTAIVAYGGNVYNQKDSHRLHCITGRLHAKKSRDWKVIRLDKVIRFLSLFQDRRADIVAYRGETFNQKL